VLVGELVWVRKGPNTPTWGIIVDKLIVYLADDAMMVSYEVLVDSTFYTLDSSDVLRFNYYNRHLFDETS